MRSPKPRIVTLEEAVEGTLREHLMPLPTAELDAKTVASCDQVYRRYVMSESGQQIPEHAFLGPKWHFLEYLASGKGMLFHGSRTRGLRTLTPYRCGDNLAGSEQARVYASSSPLVAAFFGLFDGRRFAERVGRGRSSVLDLPLGRDPQSPMRRIHMAVDFRLLPLFPWTKASIYILPPNAFRADFLGIRWYSEQPVQPVAWLELASHEWPLLGDVRGFDVEASIARFNDRAAGFPWWGDRAIYPCRPNRDRIAEAKAFLDEHASEIVPLKRLANRVDSHPCHLLRIFRMATGLTPAQYQVLKRVERAKFLLAGGEAIADVAAATGFADQSHLTRVFKRAVGTTPGSFVAARKWAREGAF